MYFLKSTPQIKQVIKLGFSFLVCLFLFTSLSALSSAQTNGDRDVAGKIAALERAHQGFYELGYNQEYVRDIIMPKIRKERLTLAAHFPVRKPGLNSNDLFIRWITDYPQEYDQYMGYLRREHSRLRTLLSNQ